MSRAAELAKLHDTVRDLFDDVLAPTADDSPRTADQWRKIYTLFVNYGLRIADFYPEFPTDLFMDGAADNSDDENITTLSDNDITMVDAEVVDDGQPGPEPKEEEQEEVPDLSPPETAEQKKVFSLPLMPRPCP
jgi:hypothetical protein